MASGVVEVVALLGSAKGGFRCSSAARAVVNQVTVAVEDIFGLSTGPRWVLMAARDGKDDPRPPQGPWLLTNYHPASCC